MKNLKYFFSPLYRKKYSSLSYKKYHLFKYFNKIMLDELYSPSQTGPPGSDISCQLVLYFRGVGLTIPRPIRSKLDWEHFRTNQEGILEVIEDQRGFVFRSILFLVDMYDEIKAKFKDNVAMINPRSLCRLWGAAYETKLGLWTNLIINLVKLKKIPNDDQNGFLFIPMMLNEEILKMPNEMLVSAGVKVLEKGARDYCNSCEEIAKKKCSRCNKVYYCSSTCQHADWKTHKVICCKS